MSRLFVNRKNGINIYYWSDLIPMWIIGVQVQVQVHRMYSTQLFGGLLLGNKRLIYRAKKSERVYRKQ